MSKVYNVYCDESCHLENDGQKSMVLGAVWVEIDQVKSISKVIKDIKARNGIKPHSEIKWTGVSQSKLCYYKELLSYFFHNGHLHYRGLIVPDKNLLAHEKFNQTHDEFYYKMYFNLLKVIWQKGDMYKVYIDLKDTNGARKIEKLHEVLCNNSYDFEKEMIQGIQLIRSHESCLMQLADLISGAISYINRCLGSSQAKLELVDHIKRLSGYSLTRTTYLTDKHFNLFVWDPDRCVE